LTKVDEKLEAAQEEPAVEAVAPAAPVEQVPEEIEAPQTEEAPAAVSEEASKATEAPVTEEATQPEKPKAPASTPAPSAAKAAPVAMPSGPPKPAAPRTWASLAASAHKVATPVVTPPASQQVPAQPKSTTAAPSASAAPASSQTSAPARDQSPSASQGEATGWQTATGHKKEQARTQNQGPAVDPDQKRAYIKNVYSQVEEGALKAALTKFGEIEYLDVSRGKVSLRRDTIFPILISLCRTALSLTSRLPLRTRPRSRQTHTLLTASSSRSKSVAPALSNSVEDSHAAALLEAVVVWVVKALVVVSSHAAEAGLLVVDEVLPRRHEHDEHCARVFPLPNFFLFTTVFRDSL
jgi:hypothetical protein